EASGRGRRHRGRDSQPRQSRGAGYRSRRHQPGGQGDRHLEGLRGTRRARAGLHPVLHRHLDRWRRADRDPASGGDALKNRTFHIWTSGCQMNVADSETLARRLLEAGYVESDLERAEVAVLNTCVVRQASEDRVYAKLHDLRSWKTPERTLALTGCLVRKEGDTLRERFPQLDAVVPIGAYDDFVAELEARYDYSLGEPVPASGRTGVSHYVSV